MPTRRCYPVLFPPVMISPVKDSRRFVYKYRRVFHISCRRFYACKESHTYKHNTKNRYESAEAFFNFPEGIFYQCFLHYHSILSTGIGFSLISISDISPFFTFITLSPIAVSARLWVITITVTFLSRQVSYRSFKIDLPVL